MTGLSLYFKHRGWTAYSASNLLNLARRQSRLTHVVRGADRDWWRHAMERHGAEYPVVFMPPHKGRGSRFFVYNCLGGRSSCEYIYSAAYAKEAGGSVFRVAMAYDLLVFRDGLSAFGAACRVCTARIAADAGELCRQCERRARRLGSVEMLLVRRIQEAARDLRRQHHG